VVIAAPICCAGLGDRIEFFAVTLWESIKEIEAFAGPGVNVARIEPQARARLVEFDDCARHFQVSYVSAGPAQSPPGYGRRQVAPGPRWRRPTETERPPSWIFANTISAGHDIPGARKTLL
jgi:hypothetical protein